MSTDWLGRVFRVHRNEWAKVLSFTVLGALLQAGIAIGIAVSDSIFLSRVGSEKLPYVFMLLPLVMLLFIPVYNTWISRFGIDRVFSVSMLAVSMGSVIFFLLFMLEVDSLSGTAGLVLLFFVKIWPFAIFLALSTLFWIVIEGYFDILDAKRLYSFFNGGLATGAALGGSFVSAFSEKIGVGSMFLAWAVLGLLCLPIAKTVQKKWKRFEDTADNETSTGVRSQIALVAGAIKSSRYVLVLNLSIMALFLATTLAEYHYMDIFSKNRSEQELAALFGILYSVANVFNLLINFLVFNRVVGFLGVRNIALIQPLVYCGVFVWLMIDRSFDAAVFAFFAYQGFMTAIELNNANFIFNAVSSDVRRQVRSFAEGIGDPAATALAGIILFVTLGASSDSTVTIIGLIVSVVYLIFVFFLRAGYRKSLLESLKRDWLDFSRKPQESLVNISLEEVSTELSKADLLNKVLLLETLVQANPKIAVTKLLACLDNSSFEEQRHLDSVLERLLKANDADVMQEVIVWFHQQERKLDDSIYETLAANGILMPASCSGRKISTLVSGLVSRKPEDNAAAFSDIHDMSLGSNENLEAALRAVGLAGNNKHAWWAASFCSHPDENIRIRAAEAVALLAKKGDGSLAKMIFPLLERSEMERMKALIALDKIGDTGMISGLLEASRKLSPQERRLVAGIVSTIGIHSVPTLVMTLNNQTYSSTVRGIAARALAKVAWAQFEPVAQQLIQSEIFSAYQAVMWQAAVAQLDEDEVARRVLSLCRKTEINDRITFVLELLALSGRVGNVDLVSASLQSSNSRQRANAIESLEQDMPRSVFRKLLPLIDNRDDQERLAAAKRLYGISIPHANKIIGAATESREVLSRAAALHLIAKEGKEGLLEYGVKMLRKERDSVIRTTLKILLFRHGNDARGAALTPVEQVDILSRSDVFAGLGVEDLLDLATHAIQEGSTYDGSSEVCRLYDTEKPVIRGRELLWGGVPDDAKTETAQPVLVIVPELVRHLANTRAGIAFRLLTVAGGAA